MVTDEERREAIENLRCLSYMNRVRYKEEFYELLDETVMEPDIGYHEMNDVFERIADLIDRPTCHLKLTDVETHGNTKVRIYECSECGRPCEEIYGKYERCPHCGAVVLDED